MYKTKQQKKASYLPYLPNYKTTSPSSGMREIYFMAYSFIKFVGTFFLQKLNE